MSVLTILAWALVVWGALFALRIWVQHPSTVHPLAHRARVLFPGIRLSVWTLFTLWALSSYFRDDEYHGVLIGASLVVLVALLGWFVMKDVVAGVVFMTKHPDVLGHRLQVGDIAGRVERVGATTMRVRTSTGELLTIPYSKVTGETMTEFSREAIPDRYRVSVSGVGEDRDERSVQKDLLLLPWTLPGARTNVQLSSEGAAQKADVSFHSLNEAHARLVEQHLRSALTAPPAPAPGPERPKRRTKRNG